jgi:hypothetical protein
MVSAGITRSRASVSIAIAAVVMLTASCGSRDATALGPLSLASMVVTPNPQTLPIGGTQQFTAAGTNSVGGAIAVTPVWSVVNGGGTIDASTGFFTAGSDSGTFTSTVKATSGDIFAEATVIVTATAQVVDNVLRSAGPNGIMAGASFTCVAGGTINANISIYPGSTVTGFPPCIVTGQSHLADPVSDTAQLDLVAAYDSLKGLPCPPANVISANLGGTTKAAGVYCAASGIGVTGTLTLDGGGDSASTFVFQAGSTLVTAGSVVLINGAQAKHVYWVVGSSATLGTGSHWQGNILALTSITLNDEATLIGRALARNGSVSLGSNNFVTLP